MSARAVVRFIFVVGVSLCLSSCGGSGSSGPPPTFTISGIVSGISGTGLVLQDNGGNNLTISTNGAFTFTVPVPSGGVYNVTVSAQPVSPAQICTVANGNGSANANVSNVQVTCVTTTYTIGGTVSGLSGSGLVLQDGSADNLLISGNGSFTFATAINSGNTYNVTVLTQPSNPSQNCVVINGNGSASTNVTNVQVLCSTLYTIGGTISGLASGTNVILVDDNTDQLLVSVNGGFTFNTSIAAGNSYTVTVSRQPFDEKCSVANGSGTVTGNVTNVQITCASKLKALYTFGPAPDGNNPNSRLVFDSAGNLYGVTLSGGTAGAGIVFKLTPTSSGPWTETVLHSFCSKANCADGGASYATLVFDPAGNLYGTTLSGGAYNGGVVFEMSPQSNGTWSYTVLHSFGNGTDGNQPLGGVILDSAGNLYGTTAAGGTTKTFCAGGCGIAYELSPGSSSWTETVLYNFCSQTSCTDGNGPTGELVLDASGNLYGATGYGGAAGSPTAAGTAFELSPTGGGQWAHSVLLNFVDNGSSIDGFQPQGSFGLTQSGSSPVILWGTTAFGGPGNAGIVYSLAPPGGGGLPWLENPVDNFCNACGSSGPNPGLLVTSSSIYGASSLGGTPGAGVIFQLGGQTGGVIYTFQGTTDGLNPPAGVIADSSGNLYGVAEGGNPNSSNGGNGVVFEVTP